MMAQVTCWMFDTLVWSGVLIALVLVLRRPVARYFGAEVAYTLWILPFLRLFLPPMVLPPRFVPAAADSVPAAAGAEVVTTTVATAPAAGIEAALPWGLLLGSAWLIGAALFLLARWIEYRAMRARLLAGAVTVDVRDGVRIVETPQVDAPVAFGIRDQVVALPPRFMISGHLAERALALDHEIAHHRGRDLLANVVAQPLLALHWFNPLAWAAWNAMRRDQEAACDARAMAGRDARTRAQYARVIAGFAAGDRLTRKIALAAPMVCPVLGDKSIVHRLRSLTMSEISPRRRSAGLWLLAAATALTLPVTATVVRARQEAPDAPAAPVAPTAPIAAETPTAPTPPKVVKRVMVIHEDSDGKHGDGKADAKFERKIERDGKTIIVKSDREISEAELEDKLAKLDAELPRIEALRKGIVTDETGKRTFVIRRKHGEGDAKDHEPHEFLLHHDGGEAGLARAIMIDDANCKDGASANAVAVASEAGKTENVRIKVCRIGGQHGDAIKGLREARARLAEQGQLSDATRARILEQLDEAISRAERKGK